MSNLIIHVLENKISLNGLIRGMLRFQKYFLATRVKSGKFGHQLNSDTHFANSVNPDETAPSEPSHQDFHCLLS